MAVVIQEFESVTTPPPDPRAREEAASASAPPSPREIEQLLRALAERALRLAAD
jgi:hypothetical protein